MNRTSESRVVRLILRIAARLVPRDLRADWTREWNAEIDARLDADRPVLGAAVGSISHGSWLRRADWMTRLGNAARDLRYGMRTLRRRPLFAVSAVVTLALGIGSVTVVFTIVDGVLLAPLPYPGAERFVRIETRHVEWNAGISTLSTELFTEWRDRARGFEAIEAYVLSHDAHLVGAGLPAIVQEARVSPGFLPELLGLRPRLGRLFDPDEATGSGARVGLLSESHWREHFGGRPDVVGAVVQINGHETEIVGVMPSVALLPQVELWTPLSLTVNHERTASGALHTIGRLAPGATLATALLSLQAAHVEAARIHPVSMASFAPIIRDYRSALVTDVETHLLLVMGAVLLVLVLACVNVANLFLARGAERDAELAVRTSLGAGRRHLIGQVFAEGLLVALLGGWLGLSFAWLALDPILGLMPREIPLSHNVHLDFRVLAFAALVTMGTAVLVGLVPTLRALRRPTGFTATGRATRTRRQRRLANGLLSLEVAQAAALLVGAGLLIHSLLRMTSAETGFRSDGLVYAHLVLPGYAYDVPGNAGRRALFLDGLRDRVSALPGVRSVGVASASPFSGMTFVTGVELEGGRRSGSSSGGLELAGNSERAHFFSRLHVDPGYLQTLDLPVVAGRSFRPEDETGQSAGIINETAARAYWPNESPLGKRIFEAGPRGEGGNWITIVGVVRDFDHPGLPTRGVAELYLPLSLTILETLARPTVIVRYDGADDGAVTALRREIWTLDPDLPIPAISTATTFLGASLAVPRFYSVLLGSFAALALLLAGVGIYGVVAHTVAGRTREIGIRLALGATTGSVGSMIAKEGFIAVTIGLAAGLAVGIAASRLMSGLLFNVVPADPLTSAAVAVVLLIVAGFAIAVPAARAMRANTLDSLRSD